MDIYREKLLDNFQNPRNYGEIEDADAIMELENLNCGDRIKVFLKLNKEKIEKVSFTGEGCAIAIATASILTEHLSGKNIETVFKLNTDSLLQLIGAQLTVSRIKCATLSLEAMQKALENKNSR